jgi:hypothetical protein
MNCLATIMLWPLYLHVYQTIVKLQHPLLGGVPKTQWLHQSLRMVAMDICCITLNTEKIRAGFDFQTSN